MLVSFANKACNDLLYSEEIVCKRGGSVIVNTSNYQQRNICNNNKNYDKLFELCTSIILLY